MKADLNSLKKELSRLADVDYLKKELNRLAGDIKKFDVHITLTPQAKERLEQLESRFRVLLQKLAELQKQVDSRVENIVKLVRRSTGTTGSRKKTKKATAAKASGKKTRKSSAKAGAKAKASKTAKKGKSSKKSATKAAS